MKTVVDMSDCTNSCASMILLLTLVVLPRVVSNSNTFLTNTNKDEVLAQLAGVESLIPSGQDAGPFVLLNTKSGLCIQPVSTRMHWTSSIWQSTLAWKQKPRVDSVRLGLLSEGCNSSTPQSQFMFTASGQMLHKMSGKCVGPINPPEEREPFPLVVLTDCGANSDGVNTTRLQWKVTASASLLHKSSGMCLHPDEGQPKPGVLLRLHQECNKERLEFLPVRPEEVSIRLQPKPSEDQLELDTGRKQSVWPAPLCCAGRSCLRKPRKQRKNTFLTTARASKYVEAVKGLACSLAKSNPNSHLLVMGGPSDAERLTAAELDYLRNGASIPGLSVEYITVNEIDFPNYDFPRFHLNWIKLQAWNLTDWDAIIMLDADMAVMGDLKHLFNLPHHYASAPEQAPNFHFNGGGFKLLRPCRAVFEHMLSLLLQYQGLQFRAKLSEQNFLDWYFRYDTINLPFRYHANAHQHPDLRLNGTVTGLQPILLHFADIKPWDVPKDDALHKYARPCSEEFPVLQSRQHAKGARAWTWHRSKSERRRRQSHHHMNSTD